ncbi:MAG: hypothetical protein ACKOOA_01635 [Sediminibacterium sp.]
MKLPGSKLPIRNLQALEAEIGRLQQHIRQEEKDLVTKPGQIPLVLNKKAGLVIVELVAGKQGVSGITQLLQAAYYWIKGRKQNEDNTEQAKEKLKGGAMNIGLAGIIHLLGKLLKR